MSRAICTAVTLRTLPGQEQAYRDWLAGSMAPGLSASKCTTTRGPAIITVFARMPARS